MTGYQLFELAIIIVLLIIIVRMARKPQPVQTTVLLPVEAAPMATLLPNAQPTGPAETQVPGQQEVGVVPKDPTIYRDYSIDPLETIY